MSNTRQLIRSFKFLFTLLLCSLPYLMRAQATASREATVVASQGTIEVIPNANLRQVAVVINSPVNLNATSAQIVFVLRGDFTTYPGAWSGTGRVLVSEGIVVVSPEGNEAPSPVLAFNFADHTLPKSLEGWKLNTFPVFQISRYGEKVPLTTKQIQELSTTGAYTPTLPVSMNTAVNVLSAPRVPLTSPTPYIGVKVLCQAGGPGSNACSDSGCSVSCNAGYYACCSGGACNCVAGR